MNLRGLGEARGRNGRGRGSRGGQTAVLNFYATTKRGAGSAPEVGDKRMTGFFGSKRKMAGTISKDAGIRLGVERGTPVPRPRARGVSIELTLSRKGRQLPYPD